MPNLEADPRKKFLYTKVSKLIIVSAALLTLIYFIVITFLFLPSNYVLFGLLIFGEVFHSFQILTFLLTIWNTEYMPAKNDPDFARGVDVFITVAGEPVEIVEETLRSVMAMDYDNFKVFILNDGLVAKKANWEEIEALAQHYGVNCITRTIPGGAKAGNINNALKQTNSPYVAIFDADHVPHTDFLKKTMGYFSDVEVGFVQSPQYYKNHEVNIVTRSAWEQQELFFGPICKGKNATSSATMCGTNMVISRAALEQVGGMAEDSIAEDFLTGMLIHEQNWKSVYVPEVLAEGLAPEDFLSYSKQQFRWARGALDVLFKYNIIFRKGGLSFSQRLQYISSVSFFLSGIIVVIDALIPVVYFFTGAVPIESSTMLLAAVFLPYIFLTLYVLQRSTNFSFTFASLAFSNAGWSIHLKALYATLTNKKSVFHVTSKKQLEGNFINLVIPHIAYCLIVVVGIGYAYLREGVSASLVTNTAWALLNVGIFMPFIFAAIGSRNASISETPKVARPVWKYRYHVYVLMLMGFAVSMSYLFFAHLSIRLDESQSLWQVSHTPMKILNIISEDVHVPLYHFLLYTWQSFFGGTVEMARLFSLMFFVASIPLMYAVGRNAYNKSVGFYAALIFAISPFMNWYSNEIRMYSMFVFLVLASHYFFLALFKTPHRKYWIGYVLIAMAGIYTHYFFVLFLLCQGIFYLTHQSIFPKGSFKKLIVSAGLIGAAFVPWVAYIFVQSAERTTQPTLVIPSSVDLFNVFSQFTFGFQTDHLNTLLVSLWPLTVLLVFLFLRKSRKESPESSYFIISFIMPTILAFIISITLSPVFLSRYLIFTAPAMYILISWIIYNYPAPLRFVGRVTVVSLMLFALSVQVASTNTPIKEDYEGATSYIETNATPQDIVVLSAPFTIFPYEYYYDGPTAVRTLPLWDRSVTGPIPPFVLENMPSEIESIVASHENLWLLLSYDQGYQKDIKQYLDNNYQLLYEQKFSAGVTLYKYKIKYN